MPEVDETEESNIASVQCEKSDLVNEDISSVKVSSKKKKKKSSEKKKKRKRHVSTSSSNVCLKLLKSEINF